jgi:hypothetical protein
MHAMSCETAAQDLPSVRIAFAGKHVNVLVRETLAREVPYEIPAAARLRDAFET